MRHCAQLMQNAAGVAMNFPAVCAQKVEGSLMIDTITNGKKNAHKALRDAGAVFVREFLSEYTGAIALRSKEPGICWKAGGLVGFATVSEFAGPNTTDDDAPLLLRIRTNRCPPPAIYYHLKSPAVRHTLGLTQTTIIASDPALELTLLPEEVGMFARWVTAWLDGHFHRNSGYPQPPVNVLSLIAKEDLSELRCDPADSSMQWRNHNYLWTTAALAAYEPWLKHANSEPAALAC